MRIAHLSVVVLLAGAQSIRGQTVATRVTTKADQDLITALVAAEDSRDSMMASSDVRRAGLASANSFIRAFTVRGLGRVERAGLMAMIAPSLDDSAAEVRAAAADALAQAAVHGGGVDARTLLTKRFGTEQDPAVRGALLEALGRLTQGSADQAKATAVALAPSLGARSEAERRGAIRGLFFLSRKPEMRTAGVMPSDVTDSVFTMLTDAKRRGLAADDRVNLATILVNVSAIDGPRVLTLFAQTDPNVREKAIGVLSRAKDTTVFLSIVARAAKDTAPIVRYRLAAFIGRRLRTCPDQCGAEFERWCPRLIALIHDRDRTVAIASIDGLGACQFDVDAVRVLDSIADTFRDGDAWHLPTHAFVSLSVANPPHARARMPIFAQSANLFVRMYAATAARQANDTIALYRLNRDLEPNVRSAAIAGLSAVVEHAADSIYVAALASDDNQLLMAASAALKGSKTLGVADALSGAVSRLLRSTPPRETSLDGLKALLNAERGIDASGMSIDPRAVQFPKIPTPTFAELAAMERVEVTIQMVSGPGIRLRLSPFDAPTNAARFVRLAKAGTFDGLTFHRVAPFFVVQGPSPNANEYSAPDGLFTRDELGLENRRGTIGLSTRGRDTGDGQIYINTVDNTYLDHEYTVMGAITSGLEAFDRMQEGARIKRITISNNQLRR